MNSDPSAAFVIVGAGLAGAAVADRLAQAGHKEILVIEQEVAPALHGSAQNAGMLRQHASNPYTAALARRGLAMHRDLTLRLETAPIFEPTGSLLVGGQGPEFSAGYRSGITTRMGSKAFTERTGLRLPADARVLHCPGDGLRDAQELSRQLLRRSGATLRTHCRVEQIEHRSNHVSGVQLEDGTRISSQRIIICAGAWSRHLLDLPLQAFRRHLFLIASDEDRRDMPWVWDLDGEVYFRGHPDGLLVSACDELPDQPMRGEQPTCTPTSIHRLHQALQDRWPQLAQPELIRTWAGLRVLSPDDAFVLGPDPRMDGLAWCTGLGGHGLTCALSAAALALRPWLGDGLPIGADPHGPDLDTLEKAHGLKRLPFMKEIWDA